MSPARVYVTDFRDCPDYEVVNARKTFELEGSSETENPGGWDTAERIMLIYATTAAQVKSTFPLGTAHPDFPNLRLAARVGLTTLHGGWMQVTLQYRGLLIEAISSFGNAVYPSKIVDHQSISEKTFPIGTNIAGAGFTSLQTSSMGVRLGQLNPGYTIWFIASKRQDTTGAFVSPTTFSAPDLPDQPYFSMSASLVTRVYPNGYVLKSASNENIPGTTIWLCQWDFIWEYQLAIG